MSTTVIDTKALSLLTDVYLDALSVVHSPGFNHIATEGTTALALIKLKESTIKAEIEL